jgi:hypothetical protein
MTVKLEWQFADEAPEENTRRKRPPRRPDWYLRLATAGAVLVMVGAGVHAWWRARQEALAAVEAKVQAVAKLEMRALAEEDVELYISQQDNADPIWRAVQETRVMRDASLPPPLPGLTSTVAISVTGARVIGDAARVEIMHIVELPDGRRAPFCALRFYRRDDAGRWLHTSMDPDYAGHNVVFVGQWVQLTSFAVDADRIRPVASELEKAAGQFCKGVSENSRLLSCTQEAPLVLDFTGTLGTSVKKVEEEGVLLAPFLAGAPGNEDARVAWEHALRELLLDRLTARERTPPS